MRLRATFILAIASAVLGLGWYATAQKGQADRWRAEAADRAADLAVSELARSQLTHALEQAQQAERDAQRIADEATAFASAIMEMEGSDAPTSDFLLGAVERLRQRTSADPADADPRQPSAAGADP